MGSIKGILVDLLNGFSLSDFPLLFLQLFTALLLSAIAIITSPVFKLHRTRILIYVALLTLLVAISKESIHFSVLVAGLSISVSLLIKDKLNDWNEILLFSSIMMIAFCAGLGFIIPLLIVFAIIVFPLLWLARKS